MEYINNDNAYTQLAVTSMFLHYGHACLQIFIVRRCKSMSVLNISEFHLRLVLFR